MLLLGDQAASTRGDVTLELKAGWAACHEGKLSIRQFRDDLAYGSGRNGQAEEQSSACGRHCTLALCTSEYRKSEHCLHSLRRILFSTEPTVREIGKITFWIYPTTRGFIAVVLTEPPIFETFEERDRLFHVDRNPTGLGLLVFGQFHPQNAIRHSCRNTLVVDIVA